MYIRLLLVVAVTLYTSRIILAVLGVEDFGLYNVIGGLATSFVFFSSSLSNSTQRFLNFELGTGNEKGVGEIFNLSLLIHTALAVIVFIVAEIVGLWLLEHKLVIPPDRMDATRWVFHAVVVSLCLTLIGSVFNSVLIARENMKVYAYIGLIEVFAKLLIVYVLVVFDVDKLKLYAVLFLLITVLIQLFTAMICLRKYPECKLGYYWNTGLFRSMFRFVGWNGLGTAVWAINNQGTTILLNMFFGPVVNAARAIASQVDAAINNFTTNFFTAVRPQIIKSYAAGDMKYFIQLIFTSSRFSFYLMWTLCLVVMLRVDYILNLWLTTVPEYTSRFVIWTLIYSLINVLTNPFWCAIQAVGRLKIYVLVGSLVYLMAFPISYLCLRGGYNPVVPLQVLAGVRFVYLFVVIHIVKRYVDLSLFAYLRRVVMPIVLIVITSGSLMYVINRFFAADFISLLVVGVISVTCTLLLIFFLGITRSERNLVGNKLKKICHVQ
ncbi:hypothetical protein LJC44_01185 [Parabacteroides sp. OttesenSCG-928-G06]|nr:hypothetical protein [Parabacteroides sp. OttesenSCG-928-G06]